MGRDIMDMNKDTFWEFIEGAKEQCGRDMAFMARWLEGRLLGMQPEQVLKFYAVLSGYKEAANKYGLWTAAVLIKEDGCSDDRFIDFRTWLIAQGKEIYMAALENPDSLAGIERYGNCEFASLNYVGYDAYKESTGRSIYQDCTLEMEKRMLAEVSKEIRYHPMIEYPLEIPDALIVYPKLGAMFSKTYNAESYRSHSMWNTSLPELKELVEKGADKVRKIRMEGGKNREKKKKRDGRAR